jgi:predicted dehydrogenase
MINRREFLRRSRAAGVGLAAGLTILPRGASARAASANQRIGLAVVGVRSRGHALATSLAQRPDCRVLYLCDADRSLLASRGDSVAKAQGGVPPKCLPDFRAALDDKSVDALVVATPDHWHCLAAAWACRAGKDVLVAAPLSHNPWEGRRLVEIARQHGRIVAVDLASRSAAYCLSAKKFIDEGRLGRIHLCRVFEQKGQSNFPPKADGDPPPGLDWNAWSGPAPLVPYNANYQDNWHGYWRYSGGDLAVDAVHQLDLARWLCGLAHPKSVHAVGGRLDAPGGNETPDTLVATYEFQTLLMTLELSLATPYMLKISSAVRNGDLFPYWPQCAARIEIYGSEAMMVIGPHGAGWQVFGRPRREQPAILEQAYGQPTDPPHQEDFLRCLRTRRPPAADAEAGHLSALLVHYANMSLRTGGEKLRIDPHSEEVLDNPAAMRLFRRSGRPGWTLDGA